MIIKGYIISTSEGGRKARVKTSEGEILTNVLMLYNYGEASNMQSDESSLVLLLFPMGSKTSAFGIPYNVLLQPALEITEKVIGNLKKGNKITFKADGSNEVQGNTDIFGRLTTESWIDTFDHLKVQGTKVVDEQQPAIPNPTGGIIVDSECRAQLILLLNAARAHGLIAP